MVSKKIKIAAIIILLIAVVGICYYLFLEGETIKDGIVYQFDAPEYQGKNTNDLGSTVIAVATLVGYLVKTPDEQLRAEAAKICAQDPNKCLDKYAPNEATKTACKDMIVKSKQFKERIKNENSIILGFNKKMLELQTGLCPQIETPIASDSGFSEPLEGVPGTFITTDPECLKKTTDYYNARETTLALQNCLSEFNKGANEEKKALEQSLANSDKIDSCLSAFVAKGWPTNKPQREATVEFTNELSKEEATKIAKAGITFTTADETSSCDVEINRGETKPAECRTIIHDGTNYQMTASNVFALNYLVGRNDVIKIMATDPQFQKELPNQCPSGEVQ